MQAFGGFYYKYKETVDVSSYLLYWKEYGKG